MPYGMFGAMGVSIHVLDGSLDAPREKGKFGVGRGRPIVKYRDNGA